jgi:SAM-dependent methyltransferase
MAEIEYDAATYGERIADVYDDWHTTVEEEAIATLALLANGGRALELGIGTGRVALPLASQGVAVHGLDASPAMIAQLRAKPGGDAIPITIGDFAGCEVEGEFALVYIVVNTFFGLLTQEDQVRCFRNVARHLTQDGVFLIEAFAPDMSFLSKGQSVRARQISTEHVSFLVAKHDPIAQRIIQQEVVITDQGTRLFPLQIRYAWPSELDLMAQLAGMRLRHRWGGWRREAFTAESGKHISVYERTRV